MALGAILGTTATALGTGLQMTGARRNARAQERALQARQAVVDDTNAQQQAITNQIGAMLQSLSAQRQQGLGQLLEQMTAGRQDFVEGAQEQQRAGLEGAAQQVIGEAPAAQGPAFTADIAARQAARERLGTQFDLASMLGARQQLGAFEQRAQQQFGLGELERAQQAQDIFGQASIGRALLGEQTAQGEARFQEQLRRAQGAGGAPALIGSLLQGAGQLGSIRGFA